jgi:hypothetical protein
MNISLENSLGFFPLFAAYPAVMAVIGLVVTVLLAVGVHRDAVALQAQGRKLRFLGPGTWALTTVGLGLMGAAFYWTVHHSRLAARA